MNNNRVGHPAAIHVVVLELAKRLNEINDLDHELRELNGHPPSTYAHQNKDEARQLVIDRMKRQAVMTTIDDIIQKENEDANS